MSFQIDLRPRIPLLNPDGTNYQGTGPIGPGQFAQQPNVGLSAGGDGGQATATVDGRTDRPTPLSRWYATVTGLPTDAVTVELDDDSDGRSSITVPTEVATPIVGDRVIVDFRPDGLVAITAVVA